MSEAGQPFSGGHGRGERTGAEAHLARARVLLVQGRFENAEAEARAALVSEPDSADAHATLAQALLGLGRRDEAQRAAEASVGAAPDDPFCHYVRGAVLFDRHDFEGAAAAAVEVTRLDPAYPDGHALLAEVRYHQRRWVEAQQAAERGLSLDPEHGRSIRVRSLALLQQGKGGEARAALEEALAREPDDDATHAALGWARLDAGRYEEALVHFREALRLDPTSDSARSGMLEALKGRHRIYGALLRYFVFMSKLSSGQQWAIVVGGYLGFRYVRDLSKKNPELAPWLLPLIVAYVVFVALTWIGEPFFNLLLRANRYGRHLLSATDRHATNWLAGALALGVSLALAGLATGRTVLLLSAFACALVLLPLMGVFRCRPGWPRLVMGLISAGLAVVAATSLAVMELTESERVAKLGLTLWNGFLIGSLLSQFAANALGSVTPRR